jgi:hypothetical protein
VPEAVRIVAGELRSVGPDELLADESDEALVDRAVALGERGDRAAVEGTPLDRSTLEDRALGGIELVQPCGEQRVNRRACRVGRSRAIERRGSWRR